MTKHLSYPLRLLFLLICVFFAPHVQAQITGPTTVCAGAYIVMADTARGGVWSSSNIAVAVANSTDGTVVGVSAGTAVISYTTSRHTDVLTVTVHASPSAMTGGGYICYGSTTVVADTTAGGVWTSSDITVATVGSASGVVTGTGGGSAMLSYTVAGCSTTNYINVSHVPDTLIGCNNVGVGDTLILPGIYSGGMYSSDYSIASAYDGEIRGVAPGSVTIRLIDPYAGCYVGARHITVTPTTLIRPFTGNTVVCAGGSSALADIVAGGIWSSSDTASATINSSGIIHGLAAGGGMITYSTTGGAATCIFPFAVNALPGPFTGPDRVCAGDTITLNCDRLSYGSTYISIDYDYDHGGIPIDGYDAGGRYTSSDTSIATLTGYFDCLFCTTYPTDIAGRTPGTSVITFTDFNTECSASTTVTVDAITTVPAITGHTDECVGSSVLLSDALAGGRWSAVNAHATVSGGLVLGASPGTDTITYTIINACGTFPTTRVVTVNPIPSAGIISGADSVCPGAFITLTESVSGGLWHSVNAHATVLSGVVGGVSAGIDTIQYSVTTCAASTVSKVVIVKPLPSAGIISGPAMVCLGSFDTLTESVPGGAWHSSYDTVAAITASGYVLPATVGVTNISYSVTNTCGTTVATRSVTVNTEPSVDTIGGAATLCEGATTLYTDPTTGGTWISEDTTIARISSTGTLTGRASGYATIGYAVTNACGTTTAHTDVTIIALPDTGVIVVPASVCADGSAILYDSVYGGTWHMADTAIATIDSIGIMTAVSAGTTLVTYTVSNTCGTRSTTAIVTIDPLPGAGHITGGMVSLCEGAAITLTDTTTGGIWRSMYSFATIDSTTGLVTGAAGGVDTLSYEVTNGCGTAAAVTAVTVNPLPVAASITGPSGLCLGSVDTLTDATAGGAWYSSDPTTALLDTNGYVTGPGEGTATIYYVVTNSCGTDTASEAISVDIPVQPILGATEVCPFSTIILLDAITGGTWGSSDYLVAPVLGGIVLGLTSGTATITYSVTNACGTTEASLNVTVLSSSVCGSAVAGAPVAQPAGLDVYPNPNNGACTAHVYTQENEPALITITDVVGRKLQEYSATTNAEIPVKINTPGIYLITAATASGRYMAKVVAE